MKNIYVVLALGTDCDGVEANNKHLSIYYSKKVAERRANKSNEWSDGLHHVVTPVTDILQKSGSFYEPKTNFYYIGV